MVNVELTLQLRDLVKVVRQLKQQREGLRPGMPAGMVGILMSIDQLNGRDDVCHAKELAHLAGLDQSTVSRAVGALVSHGLVERVPDPADRRASILAVTGAGREALQQAREWFEGVLIRALEQWGDDEIDALTASLGRFVADLDGALRDGLPGDGPLPNRSLRGGPPPNESLRDGPPGDGALRDGPPPNESLRDGPPGDGALPNRSLRGGPPPSTSTGDSPPHSDSPTNESPAKELPAQEPPRSGTPSDHKLHNEKIMETTR